MAINMKRVELIFKTILPKNTKIKKFDISGFSAEQQLIKHEIFKSKSEKNNITYIVKGIPIEILNQLDDLPSWFIKCLNINVRYAIIYKTHTISFPLDFDKKIVVKRTAEWLEMIENNNKICEICQEDKKHFFSCPECGNISCFDCHKKCDNCPFCRY